MRYMFLFVVSAVIFLTGCGKSELARIIVPPSLDYENPRFAKADLDLNQGEIIEFWTEMDMEYSGKFDLRYLVKVIHNNRIIGKYEIDPLKPQRRKIISNKTGIINDGKTREKCFCQYYSYEVMGGPGKYIFEVALAGTPKAKGGYLSINSAELILKK